VKQCDKKAQNYKPATLCHYIAHDSKHTTTEKAINNRLWT